MDKKKLFLFVGGIIAFSAAAIPLGLGIDTLVYSLFLFCGVLMVAEFHHLHHKKVIPISPEQQPLVQQKNQLPSSPSVKDVVQEKNNSSGWRMATASNHDAVVSQVPLFHDAQNKQAGVTARLSTKDSVSSLPVSYSVEVVDIVEQPITPVKKVKEVAPVVEEPAVIPLDVDKPKYDQEYWKRKLEEKERRGVK